MSTLANAQPVTGRISVQGESAGAFAALVKLFASFSETLAVARECEAEFSRNGHIEPETLRKLQKQIKSH